MAQWFDEKIETENIKPDIYGVQSFRVLYSDFVKLAGRKPNRYFRDKLKIFGYRIRKYKREIEITKINP